MPRGAVVRPSTTLAPDARADIVARGLFQAGRTDFYDIACLDTGADCYSGTSSIDVLEDYEKRKEGKYGDRCTPYGNFTPLICSIYGTLAPQASKVAHRVAQQVDPEREERDAVVDLHHTCIQVAVLKAVSLCIRARSWNSLPGVGGAEVLEDASGWMATLDARADL